MPYRTLISYFKPDTPLVIGMITSLGTWFMETFESLQGIEVGKWLVALTSIVAIAKASEGWLKERARRKHDEKIFKHEEDLLNRMSDEEKKRYFLEVRQDDNK